MSDLSIRAVVRAILEGKGFDEVQNKLKQLDAEAKKTKGGIGGIGSQFGSLAVKASAFAAGFFAVEKVARFVVGAAADVELFNRRMLSLKNTMEGLGFGERTYEAREFIDGLQQATGVVDDELVPAFQQFIGLTEDMDAAMAAMKLSADLVDAGFGDFAKTQDIVAAVIAGRAGPALVQLGISLKDANGQAKTNEQLMSELLARYSGFAETAAESTGATSRLSSAWDKFGDTIGEAFLPVIDAAKRKIAWFLDVGVVSFRAAIDGVTVALMTAAKWSEYAWAKISGGDTDEVVRRWDDAIDAIGEKWVESGNEQNQTTRLTADQQNAILAAARRKDIEDQRKTAADARKIHEEELKKRREAELKAAAWRIRQRIEERKSVEQWSKSIIERRQELINAQLQQDLNAGAAYMKDLAARGEMEDAEREAAIERIYEMLARTDGGLRMQVDQYRAYLAELERLNIEQANADADRELRQADLTGAQQDEINARRDAKVKKAALTRQQWERANSRERVQMAMNEAEATLGGLSAAFPKIKAFAYAEAMIHAANAIMSILDRWAWAPPVAAAMIAATVATTAVQIGRIKSSKFATGGLVTGPTHGLVGEAGPEVVIPLSRTAAMRDAAGALASAIAQRMTGGTGTPGTSATASTTVVREYHEHHHVHAPIADADSLRKLARQVKEGTRLDQTRYIR